MVEYGLDDCRRFDGMSVPPVCAVKLLMDRRCLPCHRAANRASAMFAREHRGVQHVILRQEHNNLQAVLRYHQYQYRVEHGDTTRFWVQRGRGRPRHRKSQNNLLKTTTDPIEKCRMYLNEVMVLNEGSDPHLSPQGISPTPGTEDNAGWQAMQTLPQQTSMSTDYADMNEAPLTDRFNTSGDSDRNCKLSRPTSYILRHLEARENTLWTPALKGTATRDTKTCVNKDNLESDNLETEIPERDRTGEHPPPEADDYDEDGSVPWPWDPSPESQWGQLLD